MQYPLGEHEKERISSKTGKKLTDITLDEVMKNHISPDDIKISKEILRAQGQVAKENGNAPMEKILSVPQNWWMFQMTLF